MEENEVHAPTPEVFDIASQAVRETTDVHLTGPDGEPLMGQGGKQCSITVYGPGSRQFSKAQSARNRTILQFVKRGGKKMPDDEQREVDADFLADLTVSFNHFTYKGRTGRDQFKAAYMDLTIGYVPDQVDRAVKDWANFSKGSPKT